MTIYFIKKLKKSNNDIVNIQNSIINIFIYRQNYMYNYQTPKKSIFIRIFVITAYIAFVFVHLYFLLK